MTKAQRQALGSFLSRLRREFDNAKSDMGRPGHSRTWANTYLAKALKCARRLWKARLNGMRLSSALSDTKRGLLTELIRRTTDRDRKTADRWAKALALAWYSKVTSGELAQWLKEGGGVSGRATEATGKV